MYWDINASRFISDFLGFLGFLETSIFTLSDFPSLKLC